MWLESKEFIRLALEILVVGSISFTIGIFQDLTQVIQVTTSGMIAALSLTLATASLLLPKFETNVNELDQLNEKAKGIATKIISLLEEIGGGKLDAEQEKRIKPPEVDTDADLFQLYYYTKSMRKVTSVIEGNEKLDKLLRDRASVLRNEAGDLQKRVEDDSRFILIFGGGIDAVLISAPMAIILGLLILILKNVNPSIVPLLNVFYLFSLFIAIIEMAFLVQRATGIKFKVLRKSSAKG